MTSLDLEVIESIRALQSDEDPDLLATLVNMYLESVPERVAKIELTIRSGNFEDLEADAHALKSSSANIGAIRMTSFCRGLETLGQKKDMSGASELLAELKLEFSKLKLELQSLPELQGRSAGKKAA